MALSICHPCFKECPACLSCRGNNRVFTGRLDDVPDDLFPDHLVVVLVLNLHICGKSPLPDYKGNILAGFKKQPELRHGFFHLLVLGFLADDKAPDVHIIKKLDRDFPLIDVLGLIMYSRLSPPADDEYSGDCVHLII